MAQQIRAMRRHWPRFDVFSDGPYRTLWFGSLAGIERPYRVAVEYQIGQFPIVRVLSPRLELRFGKADSPLPHVYFDYEDVTLSPLCLFDPREDEWSHDSLIATTTVPWAADWLACYETWLATGEWFGGGRHMISASAEAAA